MENNQDLFGRYFNFKIKDWKNLVFGFLVDYNDDWVLILRGQDYVIDGYTIFRYKCFDGMDNRIKQKKRLNFAEKIFKLKGIKPDVKSKSIPLDSLKSILTYATKKYGVFAIYRKSEDVSYVGKLKSIDSRQLVITFLDTEANWAGPMKFRPGDIRVIEFGTDYLNSLMLVAKKASK